MSESHVPPDEPGTTGSNHSRRRFLAGAGAGLAVTAVGVAAATESSAAPVEPAAGVAEAQVAAKVVKPGAPVVAYVADSRRNLVSIQRGGTEVVVRDAALVKALNTHLNRRRTATAKES